MTGRLHASIRARRPSARCSRSSSSRARATSPVSHSAWIPHGGGDHVILGGRRACLVEGAQRVGPVAAHLVCDRSLDRLRGLRRSSRMRIRIADGDRPRERSAPGHDAEREPEPEHEHEAAGLPQGAARTDLARRRSAPSTRRLITGTTTLAASAHPRPRLPRSVRPSRSWPEVPRDPHRASRGPARS